MSLWRLAGQAGASTGSIVWQRGQVIVVAAGAMDGQADPSTRGRALDVRGPEQGRC